MWIILAIGTLVIVSKQSKGAAIITDPANDGSGTNSGGSGEGASIPGGGGIINVSMPTNPTPINTGINNNYGGTIVISDPNRNKPLPTSDLNTGAKKINPVNPATKPFPVSPIPGRKV